MGTFLGLGVPQYGAFSRYNEAQTETWTVVDGGELALTIASTKPGTTAGISVALALSSTTPTVAYNLFLSRSSTKAGTTDAFLGLSLGASAVAVSAIRFTMGLTSSMVNFIEISTSVSPTNFLNIGASAGAVGSSGFVSERRTVAQSTISGYGALHCLIGTASFFIPMFHNTNTTVISS